MKTLCSALFILFLQFSAQLAFADLLPANGADTAPNFAEISVLDDRVRLALEIDMEDYPLFVAPPGPGQAPSEGLAERTGRTITILADGETLEPVTVSVELRDRQPRAVSSMTPARRVDPPVLSPKVIYAVLEYPFTGQPASISISPPMTSDIMPAVTLGILVDHAGVPVTDYRYLSRTEVFLPNWSDPWYSRFRNPNLTRHHKSALMSFVSIQPREIRHEVIFRLRDLEAWVDLGLGNVSMLDAETMAGVRKKAGEFFKTRNPLTTDGVPVQPTTARVEQLSVGVEGLKILDQPEKTDRSTALLGVILSYPQSALPKEAVLTWDLFTDEVETVPVMVSDPAGGVPGQATQSSRDVAWKNYIVKWEDPVTSPVVVQSQRQLRLPILSLTLVAISLLAIFWSIRNAGRRPHLIGMAIVAFIAAIPLRSYAVSISIPNSGPPSIPVASQITTQMVENVGITMLEVSQTGFEQALAPFVMQANKGPVGDEIRRGLSVSLPSGAEAQVEEINAVNIEEVSGGENGTSRILASWTAFVSGGHWGHLHRRQLDYRALLDVSQQGNNWYLDGLTILEARMPTLATTMVSNPEPTN